MEQEYVVTKAPETEGLCFLHTASCQVVPDETLAELGTFDNCAEPMAIAKGQFDRLNACAHCCGDCYESENLD